MSSLGSFWINAKARILKTLQVEAMMQRVMQNVLMTGYYSPINSEDALGTTPHPTGTVTSNPTAGFPEESCTNRNEVALKTELKLKRANKHTTLQYFDDRGPHQTLTYPLPHPSYSSQ